MAEYRNCVEALPQLVLGARGARAKLASTILASPEFKASACAAQAGCAANRLAQFMCLNPKMVRGGLCRASAVETSLAEKNPRVRG